MPDITNSVLTYYAEINEVKRQIPSIANLASTTFVNAKINEVKSKIRNITNLTATTACTVVTKNI